MSPLCPSPSPTTQFVQVEPSSPHTHHPKCDTPAHTPRTLPPAVHCPSSLSGLNLCPGLGDGPREPAGPIRPGPWPSSSGSLGNLLRLFQPGPPSPAFEGSGSPRPCPVLCAAVSNQSVPQGSVPGHSRSSATGFWNRMGQNTGALCLTTAFLNMTFVKIALILVSSPYFWGKHSNFRGPLAIWNALVPLGKPRPGGALASRCHRLPPWAAPACRPRGEFLCPPRQSLASGPGKLGRGQPAGSRPPTQSASVRTKVLAAIFILIFRLNP